MRTKLLLSILAPLSLCAANLMTNGTFTSNANGWTLGGAGCGPATYSSTVGNPAGSAYINACGEANSDPFIEQTVAGLIPGDTYSLTWDVLHDPNSPAGSGGTGKSFGVFLNSEPSNPIFLGEWLDAAWHTQTVNFTATAASETIIFAGELDTRTPGGPNRATDVSYYVDNVSLPQVPEPESFGLFGCGLVVLFFWYRLRSRQKTT